MHLIIKATPSRSAMKLESRVDGGRLLRTGHSPNADREKSREKAQLDTRIILMNNSD